MKFTSAHFAGVVAAAVALFTTGAVEVDAQTADVSGEWTFSVTTGDTGTTTPTVALEQDDETLTGHYSSENLGDADVEGSVSGSEITFTFSSDALGQLVDVVYSGTLDEEGQLSGTMDVAGGLVTGTFTAVRN